MLTNFVFFFPPHISISCYLSPALQPIHLISVVTVRLFSWSVGVCQSFLEKVGGQFGFGVYTCAPSATVRLPQH